METIAPRLAAQAMLPGAPAAWISAVASLVERLVQCTTTITCTYYWVSLALFVSTNVEDAFQEQAVRDAWSSVHRNFTTQLRRARGIELVSAPSDLSLFGHPRGPTGKDADEAAVMLLYANNAKYFEEPTIKPFVRHLGCYAKWRGMQFVLDSHGQRVRHEPLRTLGVSLPTEFHISAREADAATAFEARDLVEALLGAGDIGRAGELVRFERTLAVNYAHSLNFDRIWAILERMPEMKPGALLIYFDVDVTIRPDSWHHSLAQLLLEQPSMEGSDMPAHVYIADSWLGTECVNSGFVAFRNTPVARFFLERWREKLWWSSSWDQAMLAETILEVLGAEAHKLSGGRRSYTLSCLPALFPYATGRYLYQRYCDCWHSALEKLVGDYRLRRSRVVTFVDPEHLAVNFVPNNLFWDHQFQLSRMYLVPQEGQTLLEPMVIHWAGIKRWRLRLMERLLSERFNVSSDQCTPVPPAQGGAALGHRARQLRCCHRLKEHADKSRWPWKEPAHVVAMQVRYWGCSDWKFVGYEECTELLGYGIQYKN